MRPITTELLNRCRLCYAEDRSAHTLNAAMSKSEYADLAYVPMNASKLKGDFSIELKTRGITAQQKSGRCWMFAVMNIMREVVAERCGLSEFTLSGNYLAFYDKLEKANNALEMAIKYSDLPLNDRMMEYILTGFHDGGYWDMAVDLVKKYGIVPAYAMPENYQSEHTDKFMKLLNSLVRKDICELRQMISDGKNVDLRKDEMIEEVYKAECIAFGEPPVSFNFEFRNQKKPEEFHSDIGITPKEFYNKYVGMKLEEYITITNHPTAGLPMDYYYKFHYIGSMAEGNVYNINLSIDELKSLCISQLRDGEPIWFGCDAGAYGDRKMGVWDQDSLDYEGLLGGVQFTLPKKERLEYRDSYATHAMILVGVNLHDGEQPDRWKIENSWGKDVGENGYFVCSDKYFDEFVYEAIINKKHLSPEKLALLDNEPVEINAWESDSL